MAALPRLEIKPPNLADVRRDRKAYEQAEHKAMHRSVDRATTLGQKRIQQKMKAVGLGRLGGAVGATSSERKRRRDKGNAWGAIYARGGDESRAGGALEAYSQGVTITARNKQWLAYATKALPRRVGRKRMTPALYESAGNPLGPLVFVRRSANLAFLIAQGDFTVSRKTGKAKPFKGRVTRARQKQRDVIAFVLIKQTKRAKRFDQRQIVRLASSMVPGFMVEELQQALPAQPQSR